MQAALTAFAARTSILLCVLLSPVSSGCDTSAAAKGVEKFDKAKAWAHLEAQVAFGPRPSGSEALEKCRTYIEGALKTAGLEAHRETFKETTPAGEIEFTNVWAELKSADPKAQWIIFGSHYDTKRMAFPFVGANDGASSTAALLEIARVLAQGPKSAFTYRFVFFDGEEAVRAEWIDPDNTYGSRHHARALKSAMDVARIRAFVLLDMVGDKDLKLTRDSYSDRRFVDAFFGAARAHDLGQYVDGKSLEIRDDHLGFMAIGVPSIDLIDFEYGPNNSYWHSKDDIAANCSADSLLAIGKITLFGLVELEKLLAP